MVRFLAIKLTIIGAGSLIWGSTIIHDLCLTPGLSGSTVALVDTNSERLETIYNFARRYAGEKKFDIRFENVFDRREAIRDSDIVINIAMAKGHQYYEKMRTISEKYGYFRGINSVEWNMVSDYHTIWGYYQFKLALDIAKDVEELSTEAWLLQLSNPVFELTTLISREFNVKIIGICHGHLESREITRTLGLNENETEIESLGVNHTIWMNRFKNKGEDAYPIFNEWIDKNYESYYRNWLASAKSNPFNNQMSPVMIDMYRTYGLAPIGDTVRSGTWKYHRNLKTKKKWYGPMGGFDSATGWKYYLDMEERSIENIKNALRNQNFLLSQLFPSGISDEPVTPIIESLANGTEGIHQVNIMNNGSMSGIANNVAVEVPAILDSKGVHRFPERQLPRKVLNFSISPRIQRMEWALEAFLEGGRSTLIEWLMSDPRTKNDKQAEAVSNELLSMQGNEEMKKHFR